MDDVKQAKAQIILEDLKELDNLKQEFRKLARPNPFLHPFSAACVSGVALYLAPSQDLATAFLAVWAVCIFVSVAENKRTNNRIETLAKILRFSKRT
jgi:hypothetical protein